MNHDQAHAYKQEIADFYSRRSQSYDSSTWHDRMARKLVDDAKITADARILDVATGTGMVAFYAASKLGPRGSVIGIDISAGMLERANSKLRGARLSNVHFERGDAETLDYAPNLFDFIFCGSALIWMTDPRSALAHWRTHLKHNGKVGLHAFSENAFVTGVVAQSVLLRFGVTYLMSKPAGSVDKCHELLEQAGFKNIAVNVDRDGGYIGLDEAKNAWVGASHPAPGQYPHPLASLTPKQLTDARANYEQELEKLNTPNGIWNDMTTFYVFGEK